MDSGQCGQVKVKRGGWVDVECMIDYLAGTRLTNSEIVHVSSPWTTV